MADIPVFPGRERFPTLLELWRDIHPRCVQMNNFPATLRLRPGFL
jgi:hypothetical protein